MKTLYLMIIAGAILFLSACEKDGISPQSNGNGIFQNSKSLLLNTSNGEANFPQFDLSDPNLPSPIQIAVFNEPISIENQQIKNEDAIIWRWHSGMGSVNLVEFSMGELIDSTYDLAAITCQNLPPLYWAAWAWDENRRTINCSTVEHQFELTPEKIPELLVRQLDVIGDENSDNYLQAGERITLKAVIKNQGNLAAENISVILHNAKTTDLPITVNIEQIKSGELQDVEFTFRLPNNVSIQEKLDFELELKYNDCLSSPSFFQSLTISGREVCLIKISLVKILAKPREGHLFWDADLQIGFWDPDIYYTFSEEGDETNIIYSEILQEVPPDNPREKSWSSLDPCKTLKLDKLYSIQVHDKDFQLPPFFTNPDDFIGDVKFKPNQFLNEASSTQTIESETIIVKLELEWR